MTHKKAVGETFMEGAIHLVAEAGIENTRTKYVAEYAGFSEAAMYRLFPTKEILLRDTFLHIDKRISDILLSNIFLQERGGISFELGVYAVWRRVYRYLIDNSKETLFLIRYRYSSLYTEEVRNMRQAYNGAFEKVYEAFEKRAGQPAHMCREFMINYIFEMTLSFAEKSITGKIEDNEVTEESIWLAVSSAADPLTRRREDLPAVLL